MSNCKVIALCNEKGGVAKTTTAVNLGANLAMKNHKVLLIDADPQGSLSISLGIKNPDELNITLANKLDALMNDKYIIANEGILKHSEGMDLLPSNIELSGVETSLFNTMSRETILKNYINTIKQDYEYVLIDCMPSLGMMTINALTASDSVIIPSQPSYLSAKGMDLLFKSISKVKRSINPNLKIDGVLMTMVDGRTNNAKAVISTLRGTVGKNIHIFDTEIPHSVRAAECALEGVSIFRHDPKGKVAEAYDKFTEEVIHLGERQKTRLRDDWVR